MEKMTFTLIRNGKIIGCFSKDGELECYEYYKNSIRKLSDKEVEEIKREFRKMEERFEEVKEEVERLEKEIEEKIDELDRFFKKLNEAFRELD